ncbi:MAG: dipeptidase [Acidobacteria bacterium]|nr:MAG: dipeptidase [Acidobacteriota bacterium]
MNRYGNGRRTRVSRRRALVSIGAAVAGAPAVLRGRFALFGQTERQYSARAVRLVEETTVVDLLNQFRFADYSERPPRSERWLRVPGSFTAEDREIYRSSGIDVIALGHGPGDYEGAFRFFAEWNGLLAAYPDTFTRIDDATDFERARTTGKVGVLLSFQDSTHFRTPADVETFFGLGQRISQLTYNFNNRIGSGFLEQRDGGLSVFGLSIMERMQQAGMAVDLSHCGDQTTLDALDAAKRPVLFTHANCRALVTGHLRCKTDEAIRKMAATGGMMGIAFIRFMARAQEPVELEHVLGHVDHVARLVGIDHVGIGSDLDIVGNPNAVGGGFQPSSQPNFSRYQYHEDAGGRITVKGLDHPKRMFDLTEGLIRRGYADAEIKSVLGGNAVRVLSDIWKGQGTPGG